MASIYAAIGDIHGMYDLLERLLARLPADAQLIFLGDYIDRGPDSREVVARLMRLADERSCVFLRGNHEELALDALNGDREAGMVWLSNGGLQTVDSYKGRVAADHADFLRSAQPFFCTDEYIFVHAGLVPGYRLEQLADLRPLWWIREPFLNSDFDWGRLVIHGHSPTSDHCPDVRRNRINIDTGAVYGGRLSAVLLPEREFISVE